MKKRIVCFGDSNTWGYDTTTNSRFDENTRWTCLLQKELGEGYTVIEEGLCGRTTVFEDPLNEGLCGLSYLYPCLMSHSLIDVLIIMLGTNDSKERFAVTPKNIADGMKRLIIKAKQAPVWRGEPQILIVAPAPIGKECETGMFAGEMGICSEKSKKLIPELEICANENSCYFYDSSEVVHMNKIDYMHLDAISHQRLSKEIARITKEVLK